MAETLRFSIVTPQGVTFNEPAELVTLPSADGQIGIGPGHVRLITQIVPGEIIVTLNGQEQYLAVGEGLAEITGDRVELITDQAIPSDKVDEALAEEARERAAARLRRR
jgi:F-type H+-transporting ATPase subunit epsilon